MKKYLNENHYFSTSDMSLATTIYYFGSKIEAIDKSDESRAIFIFPRDKELDSLIQAFWSHSLQVDPLTYCNSLKEIKTRLYQGD